MPQQQETIAVNGLDTQSILAISYSAFKKLDWDIPYAGEERLIVTYTKKLQQEPVAGNGNGGTATINSEQ